MLAWDVDTQLDFLDPLGRLYVPSAESIYPNLVRLTAWARDHAVPIISSVCAHLPGDPELITFGPHCMAGTVGQQKVPGTLLPDNVVLPNHLVALPDLDEFQQVILEKQEFDVFTNPNTDQVLDWFGDHLRIVIYGVVTEICVATTKFGLLDRGHRVALVQDATRSLSSSRAEALIREFLDRGGLLTSTAEVLDMEPALLA